MPLAIEQITLPAAGPGTERRLTVLRFTGSQPGPKAYVQAAVHADEVPALLVAQHLRERLAALDAARQLKGEIILVPYANPIGLTQFLQGWHLGRYELDSSQNFNRGYPDLFETVVRGIDGWLVEDAAANVALIRKTLRAALADSMPTHENAALKHHLYALSCDADVVLDLHCDYEAVMHLYIGTPLWPEAADLAACLQSRVNLLAEDSGGEAFDEANSRLWWRLAKHFPAYPIPPACCAATVELRGEREVSDALASQDAEGLLRFLAGRGFIDGPMVAEAETDAQQATLLDAVDSLSASHPGVLVWSVALGSRVQTGELLGHLVDPETGMRRPVLARNDGIFFAARGHRWVRAGQWIAKIAGQQTLDWRKLGALLPN